MDFNTPLFRLTVGEFIELQKTIIQSFSSNESKKSCDDSHYVYGLAGLARLLNCSKVTAYRIKNSGVIDSALFQYGRTIIIDADKAMKLLCIDKVK